MIPVVGRERKSKCPFKKVQHFVKHCYPINREEIHNVLDGFLLRTQIWFCATGGRGDIECTAGPESIRRRPPAWSCCLEFPLFFLGQQDPHTNLETNPDWTKIFQTRLEVVSPFLPSRRLFLHQLQGRKQISPLNTSTLQSIQTEGARECCPPKKI